MAQKKCVPCEVGGQPLTPDEAEVLHAQIPEWTVAPDAKQLNRSFAFKDFAEAIAFADKVGVLAEQEGHHPDLHVSWGKVVIDLSTHAVGGLSENDFILAAKIDKM